MKKNYIKAEVEFETFATGDIITISLNLNVFDETKEDSANIDDLFA